MFGNGRARSGVIVLPCGKLTGTSLYIARTTHVSCWLNKSKKLNKQTHSKVRHFTVLSKPLFLRFWIDLEVDAVGLWLSENGPLGERPVRAGTCAAWNWVQASSIKHSHLPPPKKRCTQAASLGGKCSQDFITHPHNLIKLKSNFYASAEMFWWGK